ncbi:MAG: beta-galactosidase [Clostridia bacterium]|nr:beta-galactosidase [Clostridia bacterium]
MKYTFDKQNRFDLLEGHLKMGEGNPDGDYIDVNNLYVTKNGKPFYPVMAEMHFARVEPDQWEDRILKMKACGINVVSSYLFWLKCEPIQGQFDFTGENDVRRFVGLCKKHGMYCALRIGPWITAESRNGGLPEWLYLKGIPLRQNNEEYLSYVYEWYKAVYSQVEEFMYRKGGNIILIQFENEITNRPEYLQKLKDMALEIGFTAPIYTATGWNLAGGAQLPKDEMIPMWGGYAAKPWTEHIDPIPFYGHYKFTPARNSTDIGNDQITSDAEVVNLPDDRYPCAFAELGNGIPNSKHRRPVITDIDNYSFVMVKLGCGNNMPGYYLFIGGKNKLGPGYTLNWNNNLDKNSRIYPILHYDFQAPVDTYGNLRGYYRLLRIINHFTNSYGEELAPMQSVYQPDKVEKDDVVKLRYAMRTEGGKGYIFVNNHIHNLNKQAVKDVQFELADGTVLPKTPIDVKEDVCFFIPYNINYGTLKAEYATVQPLLKKDNMYFFMEIEGVDPVYKFEGYDEIKPTVGKDNGFELDGNKIITLSFEEAQYLHQFGDRIIIGDKTDLVLNGDVLSACNFGDYAYYELEDGKFVRYEKKVATSFPKVSYEEVQSAPVDPTYFYEFHLKHHKDGGRRKLHFYNINLTEGSDGYLNIRYYGDVAQLYLDGKIYDDHFYNGTNWYVPVKDLVGKKIVLIIAEDSKDLYVDIPLKEPYGIIEMKICDR